MASPFATALVVGAWSCTDHSEFEASLISACSASGKGCPSTAMVLIATLLCDSPCTTKAGSVAAGNRLLPGGKVVFAPLAPVLALPTAAAPAGVHVFSRLIHETESDASASGNNNVEIEVNEASFLRAKNMAGKLHPKTEISIGK